MSAKLFECLTKTAPKQGINKSEFHQAAPSSLYDVMVQGYVEMSSINLLLATESIAVEYEAESIVERAVSGG
ncbi:hypothetical protein GCM10007425_19360 [Lysinibacillus alkalisoli]|uniref:Uncharacterized protein n=1 Tax=Lysinibacillus alkalisoli TaxID=1911548 RepID=A0A917LHX9_9BACI|nr:hypothetical protein [Lysinibacillus alkalisoli]GGG24941.1 hypothetical protein GCM10007425_19360 [Lysinibacillus alkalisoli]